MPKPKERWRSSEEFPNYDVSDKGRVRTWFSGKPRLMKIRYGSDGYPRVTLQDKFGNKRVERVHILIAKAFLNGRRNDIVRHKTRSKRASLDNLEYGSYMDNHKDKYRDGTDQRGERNSQSQLIADHAKEIYSLKGKKTQSEIAYAFDVSRQAVSDIHRGITWSHLTGADPDTISRKAKKKEEKKRLKK